MRRRAVVALEPDHLGAGKILLEAQDVVDLGAAPAIDRLVVVADAADVAVALGQQPQPQILRDIGVLIFVDQHVFEAALIVLQHVGILLEDAQDLEQQIAEIGGVQHLQPLPGIRHRARRPCRWRRHAPRRPARWPGVSPRFFQPSISAGELARRPALLVDVVSLEQSASAGGSGRRCRGWRSRI